MLLRRSRGVRPELAGTHAQAVNGAQDNLQLWSTLLPPTPLAIIQVVGALTHSWLLYRTSEPASVPVATAARLWQHLLVE